MTYTGDFQIFAKPVGGQCNMACDYCYYRESNDGGEAVLTHIMSDSLLERYIKEHLEASPGDSTLFTWHGGEPLLAGIDFFRKALEFQNRHNGRSLRIVNGTQTNGTLFNDAWIRFFSENNFIIGLSIDGPATEHDLYRRYGSGRATHAKVMGSWESLKKAGIEHEILCVLNSSNVNKPAELYNFFLSNEAKYITFLPLVEQLNGGGVSSRSVDPLSFGKFLVEIFDIWKTRDIGKVKVQIFEEALREAFGQDHTLCIFKKECGMIPALESDGNFYTCDHYVSPGYLVGNILDSGLIDMLSTDRQLQFGRDKRIKLPVYCKECEVLDMCNGGCPRNRFTRTSTGEEGLNYLCEGYRLFFNHCKHFATVLKKVWKD